MKKKEYLLSVAEFKNILKQQSRETLMDLLIRIYYKQHRSYSDDEEHGYISQKTGIDTKLIELILWQKFCFEMENDYWQFDGKCSKCGSSKLYIKEITNVDFADMVVCKLCETEFIRT